MMGKQPPDPSSLPLGKALSKTPSQLLLETRRPEPPYREIVGDDGITGLAEEDLPLPLLELLASPEKRWQARGDILKPGSRSTVSRLRFADADFVIKQYKALQLHRRIRYALTRSRARQSWENGQVMARLGIPVVCPIALMEERSLGIPSRSILVMPYQAGGFLSEEHLPDIARISASLREVFASMKSHRITHGDLKASNIIIDEDLTPHFIDLDATMLHSSTRSFERARSKDEDRFHRNWEQGSPMSKALAEVFS